MSAPAQSTATQELRARREATVREHMASENAHDFDTTIERVYFDQNTILRQLGLAHDPASLRGRLALVLNHPLTIGRAILGARKERR